MKIAKRFSAWRKQEASLQLDGARRVPGSGNGFRKGDGKGAVFLVQAKTTAKAQFPLKLSDLQKSEAEARHEGLDMLMQVQLRDNAKYAVLRWESFLEVLDQAGLTV